LIDVARRQQTRSAVDAGGTDAAVIAASVEPLVVICYQRRERRQRRCLAEHPLRVIGVEADLLPFGGVERARLVPDPVRHRSPTEIV
jgi:hypothetical protein